jgi:Rps23 Pro-64 3,4-dihydroxylase Tpa1-like proline 4-hydroxylase
VRILLASRDLVVADDVLGVDSFTALRGELMKARFESVHARGWDHAWRLGDGSPLRGSGVYYDPEATRPSARMRYPTASVVDEFIDTLRALTAEHPDVVGTEGAEWTALFLSPWLYPVGSALSLHRDGGGYSGAFTFFAHPEWGVHWGGELLLLDEDAPVAALGTTGWMVDDRVDSGVATCVFPRPNRLVLVGPKRPHMISRVDVNAGDHVRTSLAGFFLRS